jgi:hypothetical protein
MNILDTGSGTLYGALVLVSAVYLLWGFRIELRSLLKAVMAVQIVGDFIFSRVLQELPVFRFIKSLTWNDKFMPLFIMMGCIIMMDLGAVLVRRRQRLVTSPGFSVGGAESISHRTRTVQRIAPPGPTQFDSKLGKRIGYAFIAFALVAKMVAMAASGVLSSPSILHAILTWQPEDLVGMAYLDVSSLLLFPIGAALVAMSSKPHPHMKAMVAIMAFSILSPWKADAIKMALIYGLAVSHFGMHELKAIFWSRRALAVFLAIVFIFSVKAQYRYFGQASTDPGSLLGGFIATRVVTGRVHCHNIVSVYGRYLPDIFVCCRRGGERGPAHVRRI